LGYECYLADPGHYGFAVILQVTEYSGFLWDSSSGIEMKDATVLENSATNGNGKHPHPRPYLGHFYVSKYLTTQCSIFKDKRELTAVLIPMTLPGVTILIIYQTHCKY